jgi:cysteine synthase
VPDVLNTSIIDEIVQVSNDNAFETARKLARDGALHYWSMITLGRGWRTG